MTPAIPAHDAERLRWMVIEARARTMTMNDAVNAAYAIGVERGRAEQLAECERDLPEAIEAGIGWAETHPGVEMLTSRAGR